MIALILTFVGLVFHKNTENFKNKRRKRKISMKFIFQIISYIGC